MTNGPTAKKGLSPIAWVAIGCAGILVLGGIAATLAGWFLFGKAREFAEQAEGDPVAAIAQVIAATNPEIELLSADSDEGYVSFRNTRTGEEFTFSYEDIEEGRFSFTSDGETASFDIDADNEEGQVTITTDEGSSVFRAGAGTEDLPGWLTVYPGATSEGTYASQTPAGRAGGFGFETTDSVEQVLEFYVEAFETAGLQIENRTTTPDGAVVIAASSDGARGAQLTISGKGGGAEGLVNFTEK